ncbi:hypothetical protein [Glycomyces paridis]|uniref:Uncharacterized protein n=1 Tax=Glycomyces paridis TaxID=2126555 RepID=A0A4S8PIL1_9ACTN|nr:hypothetical protein [Glycomyces paridis]THV29525.1 hypothetical protein E9998_08440 [Glycomyces paridis]
MEPPKALADWARKGDQAEREWARQSVDVWARQAAFAQPLRWGEAEAAVLEREYPPLPGSAVVRVVGLVGWIGTAIIAVPALGAGLVGFALVAVGTRPGAAENWLSLASFLFLLAVVAVCSSLGYWWQTRRRSLVFAASDAGAVLGSGAAFAVLFATHATVSSWLVVLMAATGVLGLVSLVLALASKPEGRPKQRKPPRRGPRGDKRARALRARKRLLEILVHRGLVDLDEADRIRVGEMPLGYWSELDGLDERERRRVLEMRHVGWRDFTPEDAWKGNA